MSPRLAHCTDAQSWSEQLEREAMEPIFATTGGPDRVSLGSGAASLATRDHAALVYWTPAELLRTVVPYLAEGLRAGDKVVYVAHDLSPEVIERALAAAGVDVAQARAAGRLVLSTARDAFFPTGRFDVEAALHGVQALAAAAAVEGYSRVRLSVEMTYLLDGAPGIEAGPEFEARANDEVFARFPFVCICSFNGSREVPAVLAEVLRTHPVLLVGGIPLRNPYFQPGFDGRRRARTG